MQDDTQELRDGEMLRDGPAPADAAIEFIGRIRTPWTSRKDCPRQGRLDGPDCRIEIAAAWAPALRGLEAYEFVDVLYWLDRSRRDLVLQNPARKELFGTFALRSPNRPNPIGLAVARLVRIEGNVVVVRGLDCLDGTPLIDLKPDRCAFSPKAPPKPGVDA
jgi:tRNA-Thr(GGU) m(6)t(6)A37 methyltransferase TsaA